MGATAAFLEGVAKIEEAALRPDFWCEMRAQSAAFCCRLSVWRRWGVPLLKAAAEMRETWAIVARGAFWGVRAARGRGLSNGEDERLGFSARGVFVGESRRNWQLMASWYFRFVSLSIRSMVRRMISNALRRSPVCEATFLEQSWIAAGWKKGISVAWLVELADDRDRSFVVMTDAICGAVYGRNGSSCGFRFLAFSRGRKRSVKSRAFAIPITTNRDERCKDHSNSVYRISKSKVKR